jgi:predicted Zn-dependent peptidase
MLYKKINPFVHLVYSPMDRKQLDIEIILSAGGSFYEDGEDRGRMHLMEHCIASRLSNMNFKEFKDWQFRENIMINAYTSPTLLAVKSYSHREQFEPAFSVCCEMILQPTFDQEILDQEREIVLREITERSGDPSYIVYYHTMSEVFTPESILNHKVLGSSECVSKTTIEDLSRLHQKALSQSQIVINVTGGGLDMEYIQKTVEKYLSLNLPYLSGGDKKEIDYQPESQIKDFGYKAIVHPQAHEQADLTIYIPCRVTFENSPSLRIFDDLFLKYYGRLYGILREEKGYIYSMYSSFDFDLQVLELNMSCEVAYVKPIFEEYFDEKKLLELKKVVRLKVALSTDSASNINRFSNNNLFTFGKFDSFEDYEKKLVAVELKNIKEIYDNLQSNIQKMQIVVVSKDEKIQEVEI